VAGLGDDDAGGWHETQAQERFEVMAEHYLRNTVFASAYCRKCGKFTSHRIDDARVGPCLACLERLAQEKPVPRPEPEDLQGGLFEVKA
jgi:hypothetical protein